MEWRPLEEHFRVAVTPEPGPFGDDAIEWDYSRYARGLGLTAEPAADDLPHRGCAVLALPAARWDAAEQKYRAWAERHGWSVWRVGARPTVAVPDPLVYALGVGAAGPDSLLFARAAQARVPAMGSRPRSEGMSFPLTPGERWLIATNRVRRRMRTEVAMRGLVLFVDEAEWLTPAGLAVLMYLLDAHRAWHARMLSRPARAYVVLAAAPQHEALVVRMLKRFGLAGHPPVARERRKEAKEAAGFVPPALRDIEEEHLFGALAAAPAALAEEDVRALFGASAIDRCRALVERGLLRRRTEAGQTCYLPDPALPSGLTTPSPRVLRAIDGRYRQRALRGQEHLTLARAALALELGDPLRAAATVARMPYTAGAVLPHRLFEALDATLDRSRARLRADHASAWFSLAAHHRAYDHAREVANLITDRELRTWKETFRVVQVMLCTGRTHLDTCLPPDFWPRLKSQHLVGPFMDVTCVVGEMFWRKRYLDLADIRQRYEFACDCFAQWERPRSAWFERLERLVHLTTYRAALHIGVPSKVLSLAHGPADTAPQETLRSFLRRHQLPAYVSSAPMFAESALGYVCPPRSFDCRDRFLAVAFTGTTGQPEDLAVSAVTTVDYLSRHGVRLLVRDVLDDGLLFAPRRVNPGDRRKAGRLLLSATGGREYLIGSHSLCPSPGRDADDETIAADARMAAGDLAGARDLIATGLAKRSRWPLTVGMLIASHIVVAQKALDRRSLVTATDLVEQNRSLLTHDLCAYLTAFLDAGRAVCSGAFDEADRHFRAAHFALTGTYEWARTLKQAAVWNSSSARRASRFVKSWSSGGRGQSIWNAIRILCSGPAWRRSSPSLRTRAALCLDHLWHVLDAWSRVAVDDDELLRVAFFLKDAVDTVFRPLGRDFLGIMAEWAPTFYGRLHKALHDKIGGLDVAVPETRAVSAALLTIEQTWKSSHMVAVDDRCARVTIRECDSKAKRARRLSETWCDDATAYAQLYETNGAVRAGEFSRVAYGYVGAGAKPVATMLDYHVVSLDNGKFEVSVDVGVTPPQALSARAAARRDPAVAFQGHSAAARRVRGMIESAAKCTYPVLVLGETGVGKDLVAQCIHAASARRGRSMAVAECAGMAESLLESELFGHEKGAFTGAHARHEGFFERANGSTLLLDEVDSMVARLQAMMLRVLEAGEYRPVGASSVRKSDFRLISAALPRLLEMVECGQFRRDLFYRISTLRIEIPPLREREEDSAEIAAAHARTLGFRLTAGAQRAVAKYGWPGNVRQLRHCIQAAGLHGSDGRIGETAIGDVIAAYGGAPGNGQGDEARGLDAAWARALRSLERMGRFGAWDFARAAELSRRSAQRYVAQLLRDGRIVRVGAGRTTKYSIRT